jgi:hypothetical protein
MVVPDDAANRCRRSSPSKRSPAPAAFRLHLPGQMGTSMERRCRTRPQRRVLRLAVQRVHLDLHDYSPTRSSPVSVALDSSRLNGNMRPGAVVLLDCHGLTRLPIRPSAGPAARCRIMPRSHRSSGDRRSGSSTRYRVSLLQAHLFHRDSHRAAHTWGSWWTALPQHGVGSEHIHRAERRCRDAGHPLIQSRSP